jgi:hypothetical protein
VPIAPRDFITFPPARCHQNQRAIHPGQFYEWVRANTPKSAEAILIGGNRFRAVGTIKAPEEDLARPVLTANQVGLGMPCAPQARAHRLSITARYSRANCALAFARALLARAGEVAE